MMIAIMEWVAAYAVETFAPTLRTKVLAEQLSYLGIASTPTLWLVFALEYTGNTKWLRGRTKIFLAAWPLAVFATALTNDIHHWMWRSASLAPNGLPALVFEGFGPAFWFAVVISYFFILSGISLYGIAYLKSTHVFRQQIGIMIAGSLIPLVSDAIYLTTSFQNHGLDWTPFSFALSVILLAVGFFRYDLLNLIPLAAPLVIENMPDAVVVVDDHERIVNLNPAAHRLLNANSDVIGQEAHKVFKGMEVIWDHWDTPEDQFDLELDEGTGRRWFHLMISSIRDRQGKSQGRVIVARDRTLEQEALQAEHLHVRQVELLNSITRAALESTDLHQTLQTLADQLGGILEAEGAYITLWDQAQQRAIPAAAYGKARDSYASTQIDPHEHTLTESVLTAGHSLTIDDVLNTSHMSRSIAERFPSRSILALPLIANEEKLGAALIAFDHLHHFTSDEIAVGEVVGPQVALAIYKARLLDDSYHRIQQLALLDEVSKRVADSLDEKEILLRTVEAVIDRFGYAQAAISLPVDHDELEATVIRGTDQIGFDPGFRQKFGMGIIGHTAETRLAYLTGDVEKDPYYFTIGKRSGSALGIPMLDEGQLLGVLYVESSLRNAFKQEDIQVLQTLISHVVTAIQKARLFARARERLRTITTLQSISQAVTSTLEPQEIFQMVVHLLKNTFDYTHVCIYLLDDQILRCGYQVGYPDEAVLHEIPVTSGVIGRTARTKQTQFINDVAKDPDFLRVSYEIESEICVPLLKEGNVLGVINIEAAPGRPLTENDVDLITALAGPVAIAVDNARLHTEVKSLALTDALTNLLNRRAFDEAFATEIVRADRYGYPLALIIIDLDNFKSYNDRWGHPAGDKRLVEVAKLLETNVRSPDIAARYGGEEFAIILPYTSKSGALILAERLRRGAESLAVEKVDSDGAIPGYTISVGIATLPENGRTAGDLLIAADDAELAAKRLGKNRVCIANDLPDPMEHH
jgi:diguanylate cyclase (GGDEF)-like protein